MAQLAEPFDLHPRHVRMAIDCVASRRETIDAEVVANDAAAEQARLMVQRRAELMAG